MNNSEHDKIISWKISCQHTILLKASLYVLQAAQKLIITTATEDKTTDQEVGGNEVLIDGYEGLVRMTDDVKVDS